MIVYSSCGPQLDTNVIEKGNDRILNSLQIYGSQGQREVFFSKYGYNKPKGWRVLFEYHSHQ